MTAKINGQTMYVLQIGSNTALIVDEFEREHRVPVQSLVPQFSATKTNKRRYKSKK